MPTDERPLSPKWLTPYENYKLVIFARSLLGPIKKIVKPIYRTSQKVLDLVEVAKIGLAILQLRTTFTARTIGTSTGPRNVLLVDPFSDGHHAMYLAIIANQLIKSGHQVSILTRTPDLVRKSFVNDFRSIRFIEWHDTVICRFHIHRINMVWLSFKFWINMAVSMQSAIEKDKVPAPDEILITWLDSFVGESMPPFLADLVVKIPWAGVYFHPRSYRRPGERQKESVLRGRHCKGVLLLDEGILDTFQKNHPKIKIGWIPDFTETSGSSVKSEVSLEILRRAKGRKVVSLVGSIEPRKGVETFLKLVKINKSADLFFVIAGHVYEEIFKPDVIKMMKNLERDLSERFYLVNRRLESEEEFNSIIAVTDLLYACYIDFPHSSNLLTKAAYFEVPILVSSGDLMGERVQKFQTGAVIGAQDVDALIKAANDLNTSPKSHFKFEDYRYAHSIESLQISLNKLNF